MYSPRYIITQYSLIPAPVSRPPAPVASPMCGATPMVPRQLHVMVEGINKSSLEIYCNKVATGIELKAIKFLLCHPKKIHRSKYALPNLLKPHNSVSLDRPKLWQGTQSCDRAHNLVTGLTIWWQGTQSGDRTKHMDVGLVTSWWVPEGELPCLGNVWNCLTNKLIKYPLSLCMYSLLYQEIPRND